MRLRFLAKWFAIGVLARLSLGLFVFVQIRFVNWESAMLYLLDVPTLFCASLLKHIFPVMNSIGSGHPYYLLMNSFGAVVWGVMFALCAWLVSAIVTFRRARK